MTERIVFYRRYFHDALAGRPFKELGQLKEGIWAEVSDETYLAAGYRGPALPMLYFSREDYDHAVRTLPPPEIEKVVTKRLEEWSGRALDDSTHAIYRAERECLSLTAAGSKSGSAGTGSVLEEHFSGKLQLLSNVVGEGRYDDTTLPEILIYALTGDAGLLAEIDSARDAAQSSRDRPEVDRLSGMATAVRNRAGMLGNALRALGKTAFGGGALPYVEVVRVLYIAPADNAFMGSLKAKDSPVMEWKEGIVTAWPLRKLGDLRVEGKTAKVLYFRPGEFVEDMVELTRAQLDRDFEERVSREAPALAADGTEHLHSLLLEQNLLLRNAVRVAHRTGSGMTSVLQEQASTAAQHLKGELSRHPSWLRERPETPESSIGLLKRAESEISQDALFFEELCRRSRKSILQSRFSVLAKLKRQDVARIAALPGSLPTPKKG